MGTVGLLTMAADGVPSAMLSGTQRNGRRGKKNAREEKGSRPLDSRHGGYRRMRAPRELVVSPAKLADAVADSPSARSPVP